MTLTDAFAAFRASANPPFHAWLALRDQLQRSARAPTVSAEDLEEAVQDKVLYLQRQHQAHFGLGDSHLAKVHDTPAWVKTTADNLVADQIRKQRANPYVLARHESDERYYEDAIAPEAPHKPDLDETWGRHAANWRHLTRLTITHADKHRQLHRAQSIRLLEDKREHSLPELLKANDPELTEGTPEWKRAYDALSRRLVNVRNYLEATLNHPSFARGAQLTAEDIQELRWILHRLCPPRPRRRKEKP